MSDKRGEVISFQGRVKERAGRAREEIKKRYPGLQFLPADAPVTGEKVTLDNFDEIMDRAMFAERREAAEGSQHKSEADSPAPEVKEIAQEEARKPSGAGFINGPEILKDKKGSGY